MRPGEADPPQQNIIVANGQLVHGRGNGDGTVKVTPLTAAPDGAEPVPHLNITKARSSSTAATRNAQAYGSFGAAEEGPHEVTRIGVPR